MNRWYYITNGTQQGPVSDTELRDLAEEGKLHPSSRVWKKGMRDWVPASKVKRLFSEDLPPPLPPDEPPPVLLKRGFGKVRGWERYAAIGSVALAIVIAVILLMTLRNATGSKEAKPRDLIIGTWEATTRGEKVSAVFYREGILELRPVSPDLRGLRYRFIDDNTIESTLRPDQVTEKSRPRRCKLVFPSSDELILQNFTDDGGEVKLRRASR
jgi:hypothetical protein